ncbi:hypothetical protein GCM10009745_41050 [Kribbella yunnanensis]|uniref:SDR family NAD(P)-dependent oxidoreductase n=1 Tax=Kribbella yunnanensis TaxID=190194 RepID=A0ABP4TPS1_9ACTN
MSTTTTREDTGLEIAIVGMAARLPGARDLEEYWDLLASGREGITRLSDAELRAAGLDDGRLRDPALIRALGILTDAGHFDAEFFGYSARDAEILDPQHRLFLQETWSALENAGYTPEKFDGTTGLFAGCGLSTYTLKMVAGGLLERERIGFQKIIGNEKDHLATAVAYKLGLTGPVVTVQTSCSTSLVAVHMACRSLLSGECDMALAGGATVGLESSSAFSYQEGNILSQDGHCRPFDAEGAGTVVSNGVGVVVLRRLEDAIADGDNIRGVICASAINNDGSLKVGYLAPSVSGQYRVIRKALRLAGVHPDTLDYVEAHGTATLKGDPIEVRALTKAYREQTARQQYCALGSVKSNIGHPDTAAGVAGLIKTVLAIEHAMIPATVHFQTPNPDLELESSPFHINSELIAWPDRGRPRRAAVSSFGLGGTNAHLILEQAPERPRPRAEKGDELLLVSAKTRPALRAAAAGLMHHLQHAAGDSLADIAFTLRAGRADFKHRAFFAGSRAQILEQLRDFGPGLPSDHDGALPHEPVWKAGGTLAQLRTLTTSYAEASNTFRELAEDHAPLFTSAGLSLAAGATPAGVASAHLNHDPVMRLALGFLVGRHLLQLGIDLQAIIPSAADDELVAACVAGALTIEDGLRMTRFLQDADPRAPKVAELDKLIRTLSPASPQITYFSVAAGVWRPVGGTIGPDDWRTVLHRMTASTAGSAHVEVPAGLCLLDTGPGVADEQHDRQTSGSTLALMQHDSADQHRRALDVAGELWRRGHTLRRSVDADRGSRRVALPTYPFQGRHYWLDAAAATSEPQPDVAPSDPDRPAAVDRLYVPAWRRCVAAVPETTSWGGHQIVFAAPGDQLAQAFITRALAAGEMITQVQDRRCAATDSDAFVLDGAEPDEYVRLLRQVAATGSGDTRCLIFDSYLRSLPAAFDGSGPGPWFCVPMFLAQALGTQLLAAGPTSAAWPQVRLVLVTKGMWTLDGEEATDAEPSLARGLATVIAQEYPNFSFRSVDLPIAGVEAYSAGPLGELLFKELTHDEGEPQVALRGRHRWEPSYVCLRSAPEETGRLRRGGVYLITGGLGGIGLEIAEYLAREFQAKLVLVGRSAPADDTTWSEALSDDTAPTALRATLRRLLLIRELGGEIRVFGADVTDRAAMEEVRRSTLNAFGPIDGIVHAAGCMPESIVQRMTRDSAWQAMRAKVEGTRILDEVFAADPPEFFCLFSSLRAITGGAGNGDYAAANAYLDAFAEQAWVAGKTYVTSINWDGWSGVGMTNRIKSRAAARPVAEPLQLSVEEGLAAFTAAVSLSAPRLAVSATQVQDLAAAPAVEAAVLTTELWAPHGEQDRADRRPEGLESQYLAPRNEQEEQMVALWERLFGFGPIGVLDSFAALGGDSVSSLQVEAEAAEAGIRVEPFWVLECDTIAALCEQLAEEKPAAGIADQAAVVGSVPLTPIQHWHFDREPARPGYFNQAFLLKPRRRLDAAHLTRVFEALLRHHDALRSRFVRGRSGWAQSQLEEVPSAVFRVEDLGDCAPEARAARIAESCATHQAGLDLGTGELVRAVFFDCGDFADDRLLICAHHLVVDLISWRILMEDLQTGYAQAERGEPLELPAKSMAFKHWAESLQTYAGGVQPTAGIDHWTRTLATDHRQLPYDRPGPNTVESVAVASREVPLDSVALGRSGLSAQSLLLAALGSAIEDWSGRGSVLIDLEGHGRACTGIDADLSRTVGWFTALYPFAIPAGGDAGGEEIVTAVQAELDAVPNRGLDYGVLTYLRDGVLDRRAQAEVLVLYRGQVRQADEGLQLFEISDESPGWTQDPQAERSHVLEILATGLESTLRVSVAYSRQLHDRATIEGLLEHFVRAHQRYAGSATRSTSRKKETS